MGNTTLLERPDYYYPYRREPKKRKELGMPRRKQQNMRRSS
jgi:hypothetical protein